MPQIAPQSFSKKLVKIVTLQYFGNKTLNFNPILKWHTILESWDIRLNESQSQIDQDTTTNEKQALEKSLSHQFYLLISNSDQKSVFTKNAYFCKIFLDLKKIQELDP